MKFTVTITETLSHDVEVEAEDEYDAIDLVAQDYYDGKIVLTAKNSTAGHDFKVAE